MQAAEIDSNAGVVSDVGNSAVDNGENNVIIDSETDVNDSNSGYETAGNEKFIGSTSVSKFLINEVLPIVWLVGIAVLLVYTTVGCVRLRNKTATAVRLQDNIFQSENVASPFVFGIVKPRIYLPFDMSAADMENVIAHESAHIKRKDHILKPFGFLQIQA